MRAKTVGKLERLMLALMCVWVAGVAVAALLVEHALGWFLFFSPGWANGAPFGLSFQTVVSIALIAYILLELTTAAVGVGALVGLICIALRAEEKYGTLVYRKSPWIVIGLLCLGILLFFVLTRSVLRTATYFREKSHSRLCGCANDATAQRWSARTLGRCSKDPRAVI